MLALLRECLLSVALASPAAAASQEVSEAPSGAALEGDDAEVLEAFAADDPRRCGRKKGGRGESGSAEGPTAQADEAEVEAVPSRPIDCSNYRTVVDRETGETRVVFRKNRVVALPQVLQDPAFGTIFGLRGRYVNRVPGSSFDRIQLDLAARISTRLIQDHDLRLQLRDLLGRDEVIFVLGGIDVDPAFPYLGVANNKRLVGVDFRDPRYAVKLRTFLGSVAYAEPVFEVPATIERPRGVLRWFAGATFAVDRLEAYEGSLFAEERPEEEGQQRRGYYTGGLQWDRRDNEWHPTTGSFHEASWSLAGPWAGGSRSWSRFSVLARWYRALGTDKLVFAQAAIVDALIGIPPLIPLGQVGGMEPIEGLGGRFIGRGFYRRRFVGDTKAVVMTELRYTPLDFKLLRWSVGLGVRAFLDTTKVFQPNESLHANIHPSGGGGLYILWDRFFVLRMDIGYSAEGAGLYLAGGHPF